MTSTGYDEPAPLYWDDIDFTSDLDADFGTTFAESAWLNNDAAEEYSAFKEAAVTELPPTAWPNPNGPIETSEPQAMPPGPGLACRLVGVEHGRLDDDGLLDAIVAWRRLGSWVKAGELAAVAAFMDRAVPGSVPLAAGVDHLDQAAAQIQTVLRLTGRAADALVDLAGALHHHLPGTGAALVSGVIDEARAQVIARGTTVLTGTDTPTSALQQVEEQILPRAGRQTTGELRAAVAKAVIEVDPDATERRRRDAESRRRVELRPTDEHTADLCGHDLPAAQALAADARITALAKALKTDGTPGTLAMLRAQVYLALLLGTCPTPAWPPPADLPDHPTDLFPADDDTTGHPGTDTDHRPGSGPYEPGDEATDEDGDPGGPGGTPGTPNPGPSGPNSGFSGGFDGGFGAGVRGLVHVIVPIGTLLGTSDRPVGGYPPTGRYPPPPPR